LSSTLTAQVSGSAVGTINYSFWWNCADTSNSIIQTTSACGSLPNPAQNSCASNTNGYKCNGVSTTSRTTPAHTYNTSAQAKVIVERGSAAPFAAFAPLTITAPNQPDLTVANLATSPSSPQAGQQTTFSATVRNSGTASAGASQTRLRLDLNNDGSWNVSFANQPTNALPANATQSVTWSWTAVAGTHRYEICADTANQVTESDESNNCVSQTFTVAAAPQAPTLSLVGTSCSGSTPTITLNYAANMPPQATRIEITRSGQSAPILVDNSPSNTTRQFTDSNGLTGGQSYTYTATAYNNSTASPSIQTSPITAPNCAPTPYVSTQLTMVNGSSNFNLRDIKNGDKLRFRVTFSNTGSGAATRVDNTTSLSSNLSYIGNSFSCASRTAQNQIMRCAPASITTSGISALTFNTLNPLNANDSFYIEFEATVNTMTTQLIELLTINSSGSYTPGGQTFDESYLLLARTDSAFRPQFREVAP
jgi:uncharacterized repeat protein (TIGR01451 family)